MAEVNNSLALGVKPVEFDIAKPLEAAAKINSLRASTAQTEQETGYRQFQQDENAGYRVGDVNTLAEAHTKQLGLAGQVGNMMVNARSMSDRQQAIKAAEDSGIKIDPGVKQHLLSAPEAQFKQYGENMRKAGQSATANMETSGESTRNQGQYVPEPLAPNTPYSNRTAVATGTAGGPPQAQVDNAIKTGRNFDGSPRVTSAADVVGAAPTPSFSDRFKGGPSDMFTPSIVKGPGGTISSSVTPATTALQGQAVEQYKKAGEIAQTAQGLGQRLDMMDHSADVMNSASWSATGSGANAKMGLAKSVNSLLQTVGLPPAVDPNKVANWEDLNKETTRAGFDLARTLGSREAATIVQSSVSAVPGAENSQLGFKLVSSGIRQAIQRETDYYNYATDYAQSHRGNTFGADVEFNKKFPAALYAKTAVANSIDPRAIEKLKGSPNLAKDFDTRYGSGMSDFILKAKQ